MKSRQLSLPLGMSGLYLVFDPSISPHYKVLSFRRPHPHYMDVYDSETNSWKINPRQISAPFYNIHGGVYMNGGVYFIRYREQYCYRDDHFCSFGSKVPRIGGRAKNYLMESNGHLHYVVLPRTSGRRNFLRVFEMNEDDYVWNEKYQVDLDPISASIGESTGVVGVIRGENEKDSMMLLHVPGKILIYRFSDKMFEVLVDFQREHYYKVHGLHRGFTDSYQVIDTLAPV